MSDYTPTLGEAEGRYSAGRLLLDGARDSGTATDRYDEFYRMIAAIEREAAARALEEAASWMQDGVGEAYNPSETDYAQQKREAKARRAWLRARAAEIREKKSE